MKTYQQLQEGLYDPNIFKAFFMAGGPGSGKSYVVKKSTGGTGLKIVNSDEAFERLLKQAGLSLKMPDNETIARDKIRDKAKALTDKRKGNYIEGRLGLIIYGTGKDYNKITYKNDIKISKTYFGLGFDLHKLVKNKKLYLGGIKIPFHSGLKGHSDGDVILHAIIDAILGAMRKKDIGTYFPNTKKFKDIRSPKMLRPIIENLNKST